MLNDTQIRAAKPAERDYKLTDFDGLYLLVCKNGSKLWRFSCPGSGRDRAGNSPAEPPQLRRISPQDVPHAHFPRFMTTPSPVVWSG
jgi:hypothetical protein